MQKTIKNNYLLLLLSIASCTPMITWGLALDVVTPKRLSFIDLSQIALTTAEPDLIPLDVNAADALLFEQTLTQISAGTYSASTPSSPLRLHNITVNSYFTFSPATVNEPVSIINKPGLFLLPYLTGQLANARIAAFIYTEANGQLKQRSLPPMPTDWASLNKTLERLKFSNISLQTNGIITATSADGKINQALMDYSVSPSNNVTDAVTFAPANDINNDGVADITVIYPNGDHQTLMLFPPTQKPSL